MTMRFLVGALVLAMTTLFLVPRPFANDERAIVAGFVIDNETSEAIMYANVQVIGAALGAAVLCDNGSFVIRDVAPGEQELVAVMLGYEPVRVHVELEPGEIELIVFKLKRSD